MPKAWSHPRSSRRSNYPLDLRSPFVSQRLGGSRGYRGGDWKTKRIKALERSGYRSEITGFPEDFDSIQVDHIDPYRIGGSNDILNLRVTNQFDNPFVDNAIGFEEVFTDPSSPTRRFKK